MGQKVHPVGLRLGIVKDWESRWFATRAYTDYVLEDERLRRYLHKRFARGVGGGESRGRDRRGDGGLSRIEIERAANNLKLTLYTAKPGIIIGRGGRGVDDLRADLEHLTDKRVHITVQEVRQPELQAQLVADSVASQIEKRVAHKRAVRQAVARTVRAGAKGVKIICSGRLGGAEIARKYSDKEGKIPLHTLRADIDYGFTEARTTYGHIGIKVWVYRGDILAAPRVAPAERAVAPKSAEERRLPRFRRVPASELAAAEEAAAEGAVAEQPVTEAAEPQTVIAPETDTQASEQPIEGENAADAAAGES